MTIEDAIKYTKNLLAEEGLPDWDVKISRALSILGQCNYDRKTIYLSRHFILMNDDEKLIDVIRHEVSHALTKGDGHGEAWKAQCRRLGCRPERLVSDIKSAPYKYKAKCKKCGREYARQRQTKYMNKVYCSTCPIGPDSKLRWTKNNLSGD